MIPKKGIILSTLFLSAVIGGGYLYFQKQAEKRIAQEQELYGYKGNPELGIQTSGVKGYFVDDQRHIYMTYQFTNQKSGFVEIRSPEGFDKIMIRGDTIYSIRSEEKPPLQYEQAYMTINKLLRER